MAGARQVSLVVRLSGPLINNRLPPGLRFDFTTYRHCLLRLFCQLSFTSPAVVHPEYSPALPSGARLLFRHRRLLRLPSPYPRNSLLLGCTLRSHSTNIDCAADEHPCSALFSIIHAGAAFYPPIHSPGPAVCPDCVHAATKIKGMHATPQLPPTNLHTGTSRR